MKATLNMIIEHLINSGILGSDAEKLYMKDAPMFDDVRIYSSKQPAEKSFIYVSTESDIESFGDCKDAYILCLCSNEFALNHDSTDNVLLSVSTAEFPVFFSEIQNLFIDLNEWDRRITEIIDYDEPQQKLVDCSNKFIKNPILFWDSSFNILACSPASMAPSSTLPQFKEGENFPTELIGCIIKNNILTAKYNLSNNMKYIPGSILPSGNTLYFRAFSDNGVFACGAGITISVVQPNEAQLDYMNYFFKRFTEYCRLNFTTIKRYRRAEDRIFIGFLEGKEVSAQELKDISKIINISSDAKWYLISIVSENASKLHENWIADHLEKNLVGSKVFVFQGSTLLLYPSTGTKHEKDLNVLLSSINAKSGISMGFTSLLDLRNAYLQAEAAIRIGRKTDNSKKIYYYRRYFREHALELYSKDMQIQNICKPEYISFWKADKEKGSSYRTLFTTYLRNNLCVSDTADELHMHRNTVLYQLNKIKEAIHAEELTYYKIKDLELALKVFDMTDKQ